MNLNYARVVRHMMAALLAAMLIAPAARAGEHVHLAAFFSTHGPGSVQFPATVKGDDIEGALAPKGAELMLFAHSVSLMDGDVISVMNDTLRSQGNKGFGDFGMDCQLSVKTQGGMKVGGLCNVFVTAGKEQFIIKPTPIADQLVWYKLLEDAKQGVAVYFMREVGADINEHK